MSPLDDFDASIDEVISIWERAEQRIATLISAAARATYAILEQVASEVTTLLSALLDYTLEWITDNAPIAYRRGLEETVSSMRAEESKVQEMTEGQEHRDSLDLLARDLVEKMASTTRNVEEDAKRRLRQIGQRQLQQALAGRDPVAQTPRFREEAGGQGVSFVDRRGREWKPSVYSRMVLNTQMATILNTGTVNAALELGSPGVRITDGGPGDVDQPCLDSNGQTWSAAYFATHLIEHPNCRRAGAPLPFSWTGRLDKE